MSQQVMEKAIMLSLETLFEQAETEQLWFYHYSKGSRRSLVLAEVSPALS